MSNQNIGENIRRKRKFFGETLEQVGKYAGYSKSAMSMFENGEREIPISLLMKLSLHYLTPLSEFAGESSADEFDWKSLRIKELDEEQVALKMFPISLPESISVPDCFREAVDLHRRLYHDYYQRENGNEPSAVDEIDKCREKYYFSLQFENVRLYAKANLIGLYLFMTRGIIAAIYSKDLPVPLLGMLYDSSCEVGKMYRENRTLFDNAMAGLRSEISSGKTSDYLRDLAESVEFKELFDYYNLLIYLLDLVPNNLGIIENGSRAKPLMEKLILDKNRYLIDCLNAFCEVLS